MTIVLTLWAGLAGAGDPPSPYCVPCGQWAGIYPTVLLPWAGCGEVDEPALEAQLRYQMCGGVSGLLVLGSVGEGEQASQAARARVLAVTGRVVGGQVPWIVGIHTCDPACAIAQATEAKAAGAAAVLVKYKGRPRASGCEVLDFFQQLTASVDLPVFYYHYPADTGLRLSACEVGRIVQLPRMAGAKISTFDLREFRAIRQCGGADRTYLIGSALSLTQFLEAGGHGAMCPEAAILPDVAAGAYRQWMVGCHDEARRRQKDLFVLAPLLVRGPSTEQLARRRLMVSQDFEIPLRVRDSEPQARLKATLCGIGVPTSRRVSCGLTPMRMIDEPVVDIVVRKLGRRYGLTP
jgi:dihydrodipicolinate synthase/N-acetylneuraminate lyase